MKDKKGESSSSSSSSSAAAGYSISRLVPLSPKKVNFSEPQDKRRDKEKEAGSILFMEDYIDGKQNNSIHFE